jgi:hypothetical protein
VVGQQRLDQIRAIPQILRIKKKSSPNIVGFLGVKKLIYPPEAENYPQYKNIILLAAKWNSSKFECK